MSVSIHHVLFISIAARRDKRRLNRLIQRNVGLFVFVTMLILNLTRFLAQLNRRLRDILHQLTMCDLPPMALPRNLGDLLAAVALVDFLQALSYRVVDRDLSIGVDRLQLLIGLRRVVEALDDVLLLYLG